MNPTLNRLIDEASGYFLCDTDQATILEYTNSLPRRFAVSKAVEQVEETVVGKTVEEMRNKYPNFFEKYHDYASEKGIRDISLVLRYTVLAMICADLTFQKERLLTWLSSIYGGLNFTPEFNRDAYTLLRDHLQQHLAAEDFTLLEPYLNINIDILGSIPEPYTPMV